MRKRIGCLTNSGLISALVTLVIVTGLVLAQGNQLFSPGALNSQVGESLGGVVSHADIGGECSQCHTAPWQTASMADRCVKCHADVALQSQDAATLHGDIFKNNAGKTCHTCHPEHNGPDAPLTVIKGLKFPHDAFGFSLKAHKSNLLGTEVVCTDCHANYFTRVDPFVCGTCHMEKNIVFIQSHLLSFGFNCLACHDGLDTYGKDFDHQTISFPLSGKHIETTCSQCHLNQHSITELQATTQACSNCHQKDDSHLGSLGTDCARCHNSEGWKPAIFEHSLTSFKLEGKHFEVACESCHLLGAFANAPKECAGCHAMDDNYKGQFGTNCETCHTIYGWKPASFDHNLAIFKLDGKHVSVVCESCHTNGVHKRTPSDCVSCHVKVDTHKGSLGTNCANCHSTYGWLPASYDHSLAVFKLNGKHLSVACKSCHINGDYKGTASACVACHVSSDKHNGSFGTNCASCHTTSSWLGATFDHSLAAFKLTGQHLSITCQSCHANDVYKSTPSTCYACHVSSDKHNGSFGTNCASCHSTSSWSGATFDHSLAAFKLTGQHVSVACQACHINGVYKGTASACVACHSEPSYHAGVFGTNCDQCHSTSNWSASYTGSHPTIDGKNGIDHEGASCRDCHEVNLSTATCTKCHDSNNPKD